MGDPGSLLATLAQSSAAVVAIVGGFLVSRLVQLSSEREGLRRQLVRAQDELSHVVAAFSEAHRYRLENSVEEFLESVTDDVLKANPAALERDVLLTNNIPRGSSTDEVASHLDALIEEVSAIKEEIANFLTPDDDDSLELGELRRRGLRVPVARATIYEQVANLMAEQLPAQRRAGMYGLAPSTLRLPNFVDPATRTSEMRRLDESIRDEQDLRSRKTILEGDVARATAEIERIGRPAGVTTAIVILAIYSVLGIVAPVIVMAAGPSTLSVWLDWLLVSLFVVGLAAVLAYIVWYAKTLDDPIASELTVDR